MCDVCVWDILFWYIQYLKKMVYLLRLQSHGKYLLWLTNGYDKSSKFMTRKCQRIPHLASIHSFVLRKKKQFPLTHSFDQFQKFSYLLLFHRRKKCIQFMIYIAIKCPLCFVRFFVLFYSLFMMSLNRLNILIYA